MRSYSICLSVSDISFSRMPSMPIHLFANGWISFFLWLISFFLYIVYIHHIFFIHSFVDSHLGCFHVLAIVNNAELNKGMQILLWDSDFNFLHIYPEVGLLDHVVILFLIFWGLSLLFSIVAAPVDIPTDSAQGFSFLHPHQHLLSFAFYFFLFDDSHSNRHEVISHCGFNLHFPDD